MVISRMILRTEFSETVSLFFLLNFIYVLVGHIILQIISCDRFGGLSLIRNSHFRLNSRMQLAKESVSVLVISAQNKIKSNIMNMVFI